MDFLTFLNLKNLSSAGKRTARFLFAGACVNSSIRCVRCVGWKPRFSLKAWAHWPWPVLIFWSN